MAIHKTFKAFSIAVMNDAANIEKNAHDKILKAMYAGLNTAVLTTPKDEGVAQNNWHIQNKLDEEKTYGLRPPTQASKFSNPMYLANNLPYIKRLDDGHSSQRPSGMTPAIVAKISDVLGSK
jgi:hypothetical protein